MSQLCDFVTYDVEMVNANPKAEAYIGQAPPDQQADLKWIRKLMRTKLDGLADERCQNGMVVYAAGTRWICGFASRKKCVMFYVMDSDLLDCYAGELGPKRSGKSCIEFRETASMPMAALRDWADEVLEEVRETL